MARSFNGSSDGIVGTHPVSATPLTMACWFRPARVTTAELLMWVGDDFTANYYSLQARGDLSGDPVRIASSSTTPAAFGAVNSTSGFTANTWHHAAGVFASTTSRTAYLNGGSSASNTTSVSPSGTFDSIYLGRNGEVNGNYFSGRIAEPAVWDVALDAADLAQLAAGVSPLRVRPESLVWYAPLIGRESPEPEFVGGLSLTLTGTSQAEHPRIYRQRGTRSIFVPAAGGGGVEQAVGTSAGTSTAAATGRALSRAAATTAGTSTVAATGRAIVRGAASTAGTSTAAATGRATSAAAATATGAATASATGISTARAVGTGAGEATAAAVGRSTAQAAGTAAGASTATAASVSAGSVAVSAGTSSAAAVGRSTTRAVGTSAGTGTASATGRAVVRASFTVASTSAAASVGRSTARAVATSAGTSTASAVSTATPTGDTNIYVFTLF